MMAGGHFEYRKRSRGRGIGTRGQGSEAGRRVKRADGIKGSFLKVLVPNAKGLNVNLLDCWSEARSRKESEKESFDRK
jgi:hypothetical protein